jgi:hypothetical protein
VTASAIALSAKVDGECASTARGGTGGGAAGPPAGGATGGNA